MVAGLALYVDPGVHRHACAWFTGGKLFYVSFLPSNQIWTAPYLPSRFALENMLFTPNDPALKGERGPNIARLNDVMDVARAADRLIGMILQAGGPEPVRYEPAKWKGQVNKPLHHSRIWAALTPEEQQTFASCVGYTSAEIEKKFDVVLDKYARTGEIKGYSWEAHNLFDAVGIGLFDQKRIVAGGARY